MLEHATGDTPEAPTPDAKTSGPQEEDFYTPPTAAERLTGDAKAPSVKRFNRKMLAAIAVVGSTVIAIAFTVGLQKPKPKAAEALATASKPPVPGAEVDALPSNYSGGVPDLGEARNGDLGAMGSSSRGGYSNGTPRQLTPLEQYAQTTELDRLRNEDRARTATVSFVSAGSDASAQVPATSAGLDSAQGFQERLLDLAQRGPAATTAAPANASYSARDDANRQDDKNDFVSRNRGSDFELHERVEHPRSPYTLFAGTILPCVLTQGITSDLPGQIGCMISQNVYDTVTGQHLLLPQGTKAIGTYDSRVAYGQERVLVVWTRLLRPDGSTLSLDGMPGVDLSGYAGLTGHVNNHYLRLLGGVVLGSLIGASAQIAVGANSQNPSFAQLAIQGAGQNINEAGQQITRKNLNIQPTIEVPPGGRLNIFATKDLILPPWAE
jgi:type IV secretory pathway VirB10-like protein